jgi:peptidoglycan LD-endopeptidase LytH
MKSRLVRVCRLAGVALAVVLVGLALAVVKQPVLRHPVVLWTLYRTPLATTLPLPVSGVLPRQLVDTFGAPRPHHRHHQGIDIFAPCGTPVLSATSGLIAKVGTNDLGGNVVYLIGPALRTYYFAHLAQSGSFRSGDFIHQGDVLGFVGRSGNARGTPCHLHFEVRVLDQGSIDPYPLLINGSEKKPAP